MLLQNHIPADIKNVVRAILPQGYILRRDARRQLKNGEPELRLIPFLSSSSEVSIDVGANLGIYTYLFAQHSQRVIAVEPHPVLAARLRRILPRSVCVFSFAASNEDGVTEFYIPTLGGREEHACSSLESTTNPGAPKRTLGVEKRRLDHLDLDGGTVAVVKIDVEGHELRVLQGLTGTIQRSRPTIIVESETRHHAGAPFNVFELMRKLDYIGYFIHRGTLRSISEFSAVECQAETPGQLPAMGRSPGYVNNFIFVHPDRQPVLDRIRQSFAAYSH